MDYQTVHVYGKPSLITETEDLRSIVNELSSIFESSFETPWVPEYQDSLLGVIVGIEININQVQCKYKLSQNRSERDKKQVTEEFINKGMVQLSQAMKNKL